MINDNYVKLDSIDINIINILQKDSTQAIQDIADQVGLTNNPCWRRIKRLEDEGVIERRKAVINRNLIGLGTTAFVSIRIDSHNKEWLKQFSESVDKMPEIIECHRMAGDIDYLLKVIIKDLKHFDSFYQKLISLIPGLIDVSSSFSMEELKVDAIIDASTIPK